MTAQEIISRIKAKVERLYDEANNYDDSRHYLGEVFSFLSDLEKSEKPINPTIQEQPVCRYDGITPDAEKCKGCTLPCEERPKEQTVCLYDGETPDKEKCRKCYTTCSVRAEQPVCEDLEVEMDRVWFGGTMGLFPRVEKYEEDFRNIARHFAQWQKEKDTRDMYMSDSRLFKKVYELGKKDMKQEMMKEAIDAEFCSAGMFMPMIDFKDKRMEGIKYGDSIKVIVIKEE